MYNINLDILTPQIIVEKCKGMLCRPISEIWLCSDNSPIQYISTLYNTNYIYLTSDRSGRYRYSGRAWPFTTICNQIRQQNGEPLYIEEVIDKNDIDAIIKVLSNSEENIKSLSRFSRIE